MSSSLEPFLIQDRGYRFFVGVPLEHPGVWKQAHVANGALVLGNEILSTKDIQAFLIVYENGEVLSAHGEFFPLPEGVRFIQPVSKPRRDVLDPSVLSEGDGSVRITFGRSASRPKNPEHYSTTIESVSDKRIRVKKFGAFSRIGGVYRLNTISGDFFTAEEFIAWYGTQADGWIAPGGSVSDPNNYGARDGYWVYYFETDGDEDFTAGARIP